MFFLPHFLLGSHHGTSDSQVRLGFMLKVRGGGSRKGGIYNSWRVAERDLFGGSIREGTMVISSIGYEVGGGGSH